MHCSIYRLLYIWSTIMNHQRLLWSELLGNSLVLHKILLFHLISWCENFVEKHTFLTVLGELPETKQKLCLSTKFLDQETSWNYDILCSMGILTQTFDSGEFSFWYVRKEPSIYKKTRKTVINFKRIMQLISSIYTGITFWIMTISELCVKLIRKFQFVPVLTNLLNLLFNFMGVFLIKNLK